MFGRGKRFNCWRLHQRDIHKVIDKNFLAELNLKPAHGKSELGGTNLCSLFMSIVIIGFIVIVRMLYPAINFGGDNSWNRRCDVPVFPE